MKKKYTKKITQYNLKGELINTFLNAREASNIYSNYDSIIRCCLGKYETAGGYVWRFEGDKFKTSKPKKGEIKCKICNQPQSPRSMAMHLKWHHNTSTSEYIKKYGEFRPKQIKTLQRKENSNIKCEECGENLLSNQHLMHHIKKHHPELTQSDYIIKHFYNKEKPLCKCGCGKPVKILKNGKNCDLGKESYNREYIKGHWDWEVFSNINKQSKEELELIKFLKSIYKDEIKTSIRGLIPKYEIDIFLPKLNLAIEYNGLYWHSEKTGKFKNYHLNKTKECSKQNVRLIHIFSDEWVNKKPIVKNKLKSILNCNPNKKIYGRKCTIQEIEAKTKNEFLIQTHIQGKDKSNVKLGIYNNNELVGVCTFSKPRMPLGGKPQEGYWELSRYSTKYLILGGCGKCINFFVQNYSPKVIYSYSDNRWTNPDNNMYLKIGFKKIKQSNPGYWYTKNFTHRTHRYNFNKFKLKKMGLNVNSFTEKQLCEQIGYTRVWDCGSTKYEMNFY